LEESIRKLTFLGKFKDRSVPLAEIEQVLAAAQPAEQRLDEAQQKAKCVFITRMEGAGFPFHVASALKFASLSQLHLYHARVKDDYEEAEQSVRRVLRLLRDLRPRGEMSTQALSSMAARNALSAMNDFTLSQPGRSVERCDRLLTLLAEHRSDPISPLQEGVRIDHIAHRNALDAIQRGRIPLKERFAPHIVKAIETAQASGSINWQMEAAECNRIFAAWIARASLPLNQPPPSEPFHQVYANLKDGRAPVVLALLQSPRKPDPDGQREGEAGRQAFLAGTECLIAVRRYVLAHGTLPPDLQTAAREAGLPSVPTDAFSSQPMRYRVLNGKPLVYSVGPDRKDEAGLVEWKGGRGDLLFQIGE
jgi:hypothetical protein